MGCLLLCGVGLIVFVFYFVFVFVFCFFFNEWKMGREAWHFSPKRDYSDTLPTNLVINYYESLSWI